MILSNPPKIIARTSLLADHPTHSDAAIEDERLWHMIYQNSGDTR